MANLSFSIAVPDHFRLGTVAWSHGWYDLPPFEWHVEKKILVTCTRLQSRTATITVTQPATNSLSVTAVVKGPTNAKDQRTLTSQIVSMLGLNQNFDEFYQIAGRDFAWAKKLGAGPLLRSPTVFEDAVKMLATTNCSWSLTKLMVTRLVDLLGSGAPGGKKTFPTPQAMAEPSEAFYRDEVRAGYRSAYFKEFAQKVAEGTANPDSWAEFDGPTDELVKVIRTNKGFGKYAAENLCKLLGRHDGLGLDSWCLKKFPAIHPDRVQGDITKSIEKYYSKFGKHQGLALWLDLTRDWHEKSALLKTEQAFAKPS